MMKKLLAFASFAAIVCPLSVLGMTACSDSTATVDDESGATDAGNTPDARTPPVAEPDPIMCYKADQIDVSGVAYKAARIRPASCSEKVVAIVGELLAANNGTLTASLIKEAITSEESAACAECVVAEDGDTWAPIVAKGDGTFIENFGGCFEVLGEKTMCGKAAQQYVACLDELCTRCEDFDARQECVGNAGLSGCKNALQGFIAGCGAGITTYLESCFKGQHVNHVGASVGGTIQHLCVAPPKDGGTD